MVVKLNNLINMWFLVYNISYFKRRGYFYNLKIYILKIDSVLENIYGIV